MVSDFQILGIGETEDRDLIKSAFRRRAKELHPDLSTLDNALERHGLFTELCRAYRRLLEGKGQGRPEPPLQEAGQPHGPGLVAHPDQAYVFYRQGMKCFMAIHPSRWNMDTGRMLNTKIAGQDDREQEAMRQKVAELAKLFPRAYYYFSIVVHEYPDSEWALDAAEKMGAIEARVDMYRKIIESFISWNRDRAELIKDYHESYSKHAQNMKAVRRDRPKDW